MKKYTIFLITIIIVETILVLTNNYNSICFIASYTLGYFAPYILKKR